MSNIKIIIPIILILVLFSCSKHYECKEYKNGKLVLVAYKVSKHSHLWFENPESGYVYNIGSVGGRREPNINLGDTIPVQYCKDTEGNTHLIFNKRKYVKKPTNRKTRFIYLNGYSYLH